MRIKLPVAILIIAIITFTNFSCSSNTVKPDTGSAGNEAANTAKLAVVKTLDISNITTSSAIGSGKIMDDGGVAIQNQGICWDTVSTPTIEDNTVGISSVSGSGVFTCSLAGLKDTTQYYVRAFATNSAGTSYGREISFSTPSLLHAESKATVWVDSTSFTNYQVFESKWDYLYPWGPDHNGSARMYASATDHGQVSLNNNVLKIEADRITKDEGKSTADPHLQIHYHSGAIHLKKQILVNKENPYWVVSGDFKVPSVKGSWPAFWLTGAWTWPPESDIMEFKGSNSCWQNTAQGPAWNQVSWQNAITKVEHAGDWHNYKVTIQRASSTDVTLTYYVDGKATGSHNADFAEKPFWLIINLQMEGSSGAPGPQKAIMYAKNIKVNSWPK